MYYSCTWYVYTQYNTSQAVLTESTAIINLCVCVCVSGRRCFGHVCTGSGTPSSLDGGETDNAAAADGGGSTLAGTGGKLPGNFRLIYMSISPKPFP